MTKSTRSLRAHLRFLGIWRWWVWPWWSLLIAKKEMKPLKPNAKTRLIKRKTSNQELYPEIGPIRIRFQMRHWKRLCLRFQKRIPRSVMALVTARYSMLRELHRSLKEMRGRTISRVLWEMKAAWTDLAKIRTTRITMLIRLMLTMSQTIMPIICTKPEASEKSKTCTILQMAGSTSRTQRFKCRIPKISSWGHNRVVRLVLPERMIRALCLSVSSRLRNSKTTTWARKVVAHLAKNWVNSLWIPRMIIDLKAVSPKSMKTWVKITSLHPHFKTTKLKRSRKVRFKANWKRRMILNRKKMKKTSCRMKMTKVNYRAKLATRDSRIIRMRRAN